MAIVTQELDRSMLDQIREMDDPEQSLLRDIIDTFLDDAPKRIAELRAGLTAGDLDRVHRAAHTIKGAASNLGLLGLVEAARVCCEDARTGQRDSLPRLIAAVEAAWPRAVSLLRAELGQAA
jgi:HPt (histidine-containing phosphotransfer) domain-containing protein